jgi:hypothetical protein
MAHEMLRYAESKAIFTFVVSKESRDVCLLLRLLSWETRLAVSSKTAMVDEAGAEHPHFQRVAKVVYEESIDRVEEELSDPMVWNWAGVDLCCPTPKSKEGISRDTNKIASAENASVRMVLSRDEWEELKLSIIEGSKQFFAREIVDATISLKVGRISSNAGLSALPIF